MRFLIRNETNYVLALVTKANPTGQCVLHCCTEVSIRLATVMRHGKLFRIQSMTVGDQYRGPDNGFPDCTRVPTMQPHTCHVAPRVFIVPILYTIGSMNLLLSHKCVLLKFQVFKNFRIDENVNMLWIRNLPGKNDFWHTFDVLF